MGALHSATVESLDDLVAAAQQAGHGTAAMAVILRRFEGLAISIARSLTTDLDLQEDAAQGARIGLLRAVRAHNVGTPGFPAFAKRYMKGAALRAIVAMHSDELSMDPQKSDWQREAPRETAAQTDVELIDLISVLRPEQQMIVRSYYVEDARLADIAADLGVSVPAVSQRLATIHRALRPTVEGALAA